MSAEAICCFSDQNSNKALCKILTKNVVKTPNGLFYALQPQKSFASFYLMFRNFSGIMKMALELIKNIPVRKVDGFSYRD